MTAEQSSVIVSVRQLARMMAEQSAIMSARQLARMSVEMMVQRLVVKITGPGAERGARIA